MADAGSPAEPPVTASIRKLVSHVLAQAVRERRPSIEVVRDGEAFRIELPEHGGQTAYILKVPIRHYDEVLSLLRSIARWDAPATGGGGTVSVRTEAGEIRRTVVMEPGDDGYSILIREQPGGSTQE